ncbi:MAG TPA: penicillin-binding protein activator [Micropepsaceae bacterium]|nr:penicillin-binding protein activator [Micropepsaceae bacterium]
MMRPAVLAAPPPPPPAPLILAPPPPPPPPARPDQPNFYRLRNTPAGVTPARVALLLPLSSPSAETRAVAEALERAAELAVFDSKANDILLMPRDDGGTPEKAAAAAAKAINDGAEIIIGPLFAQSVTAVGPIARARHVPVIGLSSDRSVGGNGIYLLSFQPETEVNRIVSYAARTGHSAFAALVPKTAYGDKVTAAFRDSVMRAGGSIVTIQSFDEKAELVGTPARNAAQSGADSILIGEGGAMLQGIAPALAIGGAATRGVKLLGTGLWDDASVTQEPLLAEGWFAAPPPASFRAFSDHYRAVFNATPPRIATLGYDAISLVALLSKGQPFERFTDAALSDPNGFSGVDGIFRFRNDGSAERGLAILEVRQNGFAVVDPAPKTFPQPGF